MVVIYHFQLCPQKCKNGYRGYNQECLTKAYKAVIEDDMSVRRAARLYGVPQTTLRDRVRGRINPSTSHSGPPPLFTKAEEKNLVDHIIFLSEIGVGYTRRQVIDLATDYAKHIGKKDGNTALTPRWFYNFMSRWPSLKVTKPSGLEATRAKCTNPETVSNYFKELEQTMTKYDLNSSPEKIYNIDEKGICTGHNPPKIVSSKGTKSQAIISPKGGTVTLIAAANALGTAILLFYVFPGKKFNHDLLDGATPRAAGTMSESGWSNTDIFEYYLKEHFMKYVQGTGPYLLLYDGHGSHVTLSLIEWARAQNIILFVLPPHTSHVLQPLDVGIFGPFSRIYNNVCHKFLRSEKGRAITKFDICRLSCEAYLKALTPNNIRSAFRAAGVFPLSAQAVSSDKIAPSQVYKYENTL